MSLSYIILELVVKIIKKIESISLKKKKFHQHTEKFSIHSDFEWTFPWRVSEKA